MKDEGEKPETLKARTTRFALRVIRLYGAWPKRMEAQVIGKQLLRSGPSVGAHYREAMRARSDAEFISKMEGALQELEESAYWMELLSGIRHLPRRAVDRVDGGGKRVDGNSGILREERQSQTSGPSMTIHPSAFRLPPSSLRPVPVGPDFRRRNG